MAARRKTLHLVKSTSAAAIFQKNVRALLPYNRTRYRAFSHWYGASFQLASEAPNIEQGISFGLPKFLAHYEALFKQLIATFDDGSPWTVTHEAYDFAWWPNDEPTLPALRALFAYHRVPNNFQGALRLTKPQVFALASELLSYPAGLFRSKKTLYRNVDVSHNTLPVVIKVSGHLNVDILSTDPALVREVVSENRSPVFTIKPYRGTCF
jgi:hypothetical protein